MMMITQRNHIVHETTKMLIKEGLKSIRMDDIAVQLRISKRTLYELFGDKETLIMECIMHNHKRMLDRVCEASKSASNILEEIMQMLKAWDHSLDHRYKLMTSLLKFYPAIHKNIVEKEKEEGFPLFKSKLEDGVSQGLIIGGIDFDLTLKLFAGAVQGVMIVGDATYSDDESRIKMFRHMMMFFLRSMTTEKGMKIIDKYLIEG